MTPAPPREAQQEPLGWIVTRLAAVIESLDTQESRRDCVRSLQKLSRDIGRAALHASEAGPRHKFSDLAAETMTPESRARAAAETERLMAEAGPQAPREEPR